VFIFTFISFFRNDSTSTHTIYWYISSRKYTDKTVTATAQSQPVEITTERTADTTILNYISTVSTHMDAESPKDSIKDTIDFSSTFSPEERPLSTTIVTQADTGLTTTVADVITFSIANLNDVSTSTVFENPVSITIVPPYGKGLITTGTNQERITSDSPTAARVMINVEHNTKETVTGNYFFDLFIR
jgi:hypothetical protein